MLLVLQIIFFICIAGLVHAYLFYPFLMGFLARNIKAPTEFFESDSEWPSVSVIMAAYNEEVVIEQKMNSLINSDYPKDKLHIFVGSDCSTDQTNVFMSDFADGNPSIHFYPFRERRGKPGIVNELAADAVAKFGKGKNHIFLLTDASVILESFTIKKLVRHFKREKVVLVDSNMLNTGIQSKGISRSEKQYVNAEVRLKNREGLLWGTMVGPFGGCYALRSDYYHEVPPKFLVDDFYIAFKALERGGAAINDLEASCQESVPHDIKEEYRRKSRISAGNYQNLQTFGHLLKKPFSPLGFSFLSHKVLKWMGPFFILISYFCCGLLAFSGNIMWYYLFIMQSLVLFGIPFLDFILQRLNIHLLLLRNITYFLVMNIALLEGFTKYINGIKNNVWEPPKRGE